MSIIINSVICLIDNYLVYLHIIIYSVKFLKMEIYLNLPSYLRAWFLCANLDISPESITDSTVGEFPKGSIERNILQFSLRTPRGDERPVLRCPDGWTAVRVPVFKGVNQECRNYLPEKGRVALESTIRARFDNDLWTLIKNVEPRKYPIKDLLWAWMDSRGIEITDTNYQAVMKRAQRLRARTRYASSCKVTEREEN